MNAAVLTLALLSPTAPPPEPAVPDVKENVSKGLKWLAGKQKPEGYWDAINGFSPTTVTAVSGLAFLMEGSTPSHGTYSPQIKKVVVWFEKNTAENGKLASNTENEMFQYVTSHGQALLFLSCVYDVDDDADRRKKLRATLEKAVKFAVSCQTSRGGWGYTQPMPGNDYDDGMSTATVLQALFAARKAGIDVPKAATDKGTQYLVRSSNRDGGVIYSSYGGTRPMGNDGQGMVSAAAAASLMTSDGYRPQLLPMWASFGNRDAVRQLQFLRTNGSGILMYQFHAARAAYALGEIGHKQMQPDAGEKSLVRWSEYRAVTHKAIKDAQGKDGGWADQTFGPEYTTALSLFVLQLDNDYLPAFSR